jgi:hypothetical protein
MTFIKQQHVEHAALQENDPACETMSFLLQMIAAVTTYLVVMMQFHHANLRGF